MNICHIMHKNHIAVSFDTDSHALLYFDKAYAPFGMKEEHGYDAIRAFCSDRRLMTNRKYCKEILTTCKIDDQTDISICIMSKSLSFRDNYWIKKNNSMDTWETVNLYKNPFSEEIAVTSLTGESIPVHIGDDLYTGELTNKGMRAKCFFRQDGKIYLAKAEKQEEISAEILSYFLASSMKLPAAKYIQANIYGKECAVCEIQTSEKYEMVHARDILRHTDCPKMGYGTPFFGTFRNIGGIDFLKMMAFDILTLNTDRNRDNFALKMTDRKLTGLYPIYDHDSCFKGKNLDAHYFVTGKTFRETMDNILKKDYKYEKIIPDIRNLYDVLEKQGTELFTSVGLISFLDGTMERLECLLGQERTQQQNQDFSEDFISLD